MDNTDVPLRRERPRQSSTQIADRAVARAFEQHVPLASLLAALGCTLLAGETVAMALTCGLLIGWQVVVDRTRRALPPQFHRVLRGSLYASWGLAIIVAPTLFLGGSNLWLVALPTVVGAPLLFGARVGAIVSVVLALCAIAGIEYAGLDTNQAVVAGTLILAVGGLVALIQRALDRLASPLKQALTRLEREAAERKVIEGKLRAAQRDLEAGVEARTIALTRTNRALEREVQDRRVAEEQALEASRVKSSFLANMSHELRTPLNAIIGYTELLLEQVHDAPDEPASNQTEELERVLSAARSLLSIVGDILDLSKIEAGKMGVTTEKFEVLEVVQSVLDTMAPLAQKNGNTLRLRCPEELGSIHSDRTKLHQILLNLVGNACKFTRDGAIVLEVDFDFDGIERWVVCSVRDTGIGIEPETVQRLFQPFTQADTSTTRRYGGTGLGLALSQSFANMIGGEITAESTVGEGSTFTLRIPADRNSPFRSGLIMVSHF